MAGAGGARALDPASLSPGFGASRPDPSGIGRAMRARREHLGLSLPDVVALTGLAGEHIAALEAGAVQRLPGSQFVELYARTLSRAYDRVAAGELAAPDETVAATPTWTGGLTSSPVSGPDSTAFTVGEDTVPGRLDPAGATVPGLGGAAGGPEGGAPGGLRLAGGVAGVMIALLVVLLAVGALQPAPTAVGPLPVRVRVAAVRTVPLTVRVDGTVVASRVFAGQEAAVFAGARVEVDVPDVDAVQVTFNDARIRPHGRSRTPRTLVFTTPEAP